MFVFQGGLMNDVDVNFSVPLCSFTLTAVALLIERRSFTVQVHSKSAVLIHRGVLDQLDIAACIPRNGRQNLASTEYRTFVLPPVRKLPSRTSDLTIVLNSNLNRNPNPIGNESVPKIIITDTVIFLKHSQHFGNFKP